MNSSVVDHYKVNAQEYFDLTYNIRLDNLWDMFLKRIPTNAKILDLGCGSGRDVEFFSTVYKNVIGLDLSYNLSKLARRLTEKEIIIADFREIPFKTKSFDAVWSIGSLLHIEKSQISRTLIEVRRVLNTDGYLFISIKKGIGSQLIEDGRFFSFYSVYEWRRILSNCGFYDNLLFVTKEKRRIKDTGRVKNISWIFSISQKKETKD